MLIVLFTVSVLLTMIVSLLSSKYYRSEAVIAPVMPEPGGLAAALSNLRLRRLGRRFRNADSADKIMVVLRSRTIAEQVIRSLIFCQVLRNEMGQ